MIPEPGFLLRGKGSTGPVGNLVMLKQVKQFEVIECRGTPYEIGQQYGEACRDNIKQSLEMNLYGLSAGYNASKQNVIDNAMRFLPKVRDFDPYLIQR